MIYLNNSTESQGVFFPHSFDTSGVLTFKAHCTSDPSVEDISLEIFTYTNKRFYLFAYITLPEGLPTGEYEYRLEDASRTLDCGVLVIGDYHPTNWDNRQIQYDATE